jgi:hypothetical protein
MQWKVHPRAALKTLEYTLNDLASVDAEQAALDLYDDLDALDVEEVWDRSGATRDGYVETQEAVHRYSPQSSTTHLRPNTTA